MIIALAGMLAVLAVIVISWPRDSVPVAPTTTTTVLSNVVSVSGSSVSSASGGGPATTSHGTASLCVGGCAYFNKSAVVVRAGVGARVNLTGFAGTKYSVAIAKVVPSGPLGATPLRGDSLDVSRLGPGDYKLVIQTSSDKRYALLIIIN